ncbi:LutC/YkgG family protein [Deminuibacter soli]|uniref:LutC/YkgG family protein n=1 Tax=Deminuibacter soli TaxID=2291815 RepID=UPI001FE6D6E4|nr:LUD domain-containing protein [Deminuibacter soli]
MKKIRQALINPVPVPFPLSEGTDSVFKPAKQEAEVEFAENFTKLQGRFVFCVNETELAQQLDALAKSRNWQKVYCQEPELRSMLQQHGYDQLNAPDVHTCDAAITGCEWLVARTGSILMSSAQPSGRITSVYGQVHICIAYTDQLLYDIKEALQQVKDKYEQLPSLVTLATGPSRTADIEKTLVVGVHGPKEVFCFLVERS